MTFTEVIFAAFMISLGVAWIWLVIVILVDIMRSDDLSGWGKAGWTLLVVFATWVGVVIYLVSRGSDMSARRLADAERRGRAHSQAG